MKGDDNVGISDKIEAFISELLKNESNEYLELGRNELAELFGCVPSQINYVIQTRFNHEQGYIVKSKRGGGGYLRIYKTGCESSENILSSIDGRLSFSDAENIIKNLYVKEIISEKEARLLLSAVDENILSFQNSDILRANILKNMLKELM